MHQMLRRGNRDRKLFLFPFGTQRCLFAYAEVDVWRDACGHFRNSSLKTEIHFFYRRHP